MKLINKFSKKPQLWYKKNLIEKLFELISKGDINLAIASLSKELLETLKIIENCTSCNKYNIEKMGLDEFHNLINEIMSEKEVREKKKIIDKLNRELIKIDGELNRKV